MASCPSASCPSTASRLQARSAMSFRATAMSSISIALFLRPPLADAASVASMDWGGVVKEAVREDWCCRALSPWLRVRDEGHAASSAPARGAPIAPSISAIELRLVLRWVLVRFESVGEMFRLWWHLGELSCADAQLGVWGWDRGMSGWRLLAGEMAAVALGGAEPLASGALFGPSVWVQGTGREEERATMGTMCVPQRPAAVAATSADVYRNCTPSDGLGRAACGWWAFIRVEGFHAAEEDSLVAAPSSSPASSTPDTQPGGRGCSQRAVPSCGGLSRVVYTVHTPPRATRARWPRCTPPPPWRCARCPPAGCPA
mmetsp:Transcript_21277/g.54126  ORF Transcript_21277/g.54126 Transcript_21277/m.54126 type:complete len:316 (-) Transcript_21277:505-1452(-)